MKLEEATKRHALVECGNSVVLASLNSSDLPLMNQAVGSAF
jgi:hypothetical protein